MLASLGLQDRDLSILFTDNRRIAELNRKAFGRDAPTNVISFSYMDGFPCEVVGDLVISVEQAQKEAEAAGVTFYDRLLALIIHGLLHVVGHDHEKGGPEARRMRYRERKLFEYVTGLPAYRQISL